MLTRKEALFLLASLGAAAGGIALVPTRDRKESTSGASPVDWDRVSDNPQTPTTLSWCGNPGFPTGRSGSWIQRHLEERFSVHLEPLFLDLNGYQNRRSLLLAGGDVPDVNWDGDPTPVRNNVHQGFVLELPYETIVRHAPTYVKNLNTFGMEAWLFARKDGKNYGVPTFGAADIYPNVPLWRGDWLRDIGFSRPPETLEEMHDAFSRFRHKRSNPRYGMCPEVHWSLSFVEIFAVYGILPQDFIVRDGSIVWGGIQPEAKEVLALLREWYREELIDPDFAIGTTGNSLMETKFQNGRTGYMSGWGTFQDFDLQNPNSRYSVMRALDPGVELVPGKPLLGKDGKRRARVWGGPAHVLWFGAQLANQPEKVLRVLCMLETFATDPTLFMESRCGKRGAHWDWSQERGVYLLPPYDERGEDARNLLSLSIEGAFGFFSPCSLPLSETSTFLKQGEESFRREYRNTDWAFKNAIGKSDAVPSAGRYLEDLRLYQTTTFIQIIRGDKPLEEFDRFVTAWRKNGGDILTREANELHQQMQEIREQVDRIPDGGIT